MRERAAGASIVVACLTFASVGCDRPAARSEGAEPVAPATRPDAGRAPEVLPALSTGDGGLGSGIEGIGRLGPARAAIGRDEAVRRIEGLPEVAQQRAQGGRLRVRALPDLADIGPTGACTGSAFECRRWVRVETSSSGRFRPWHDFGVDPVDGAICVATAAYDQLPEGGTCQELETWRRARGR